MVDHKNQFRVLVLTEGPAVVTLKAHSFQHCKGQFNGNCRKKPNHTVLLVDRNTSNWIIKNNWGEKLDNKGYLYLKRGENLCGVQHNIGGN